MSQGALSVPGGDGASVRSGFNAAIARLATKASGTSRPSDIAAGEDWIETDNPGGGTWSWWLYDGSTDILLGTINSSTHVFTPVAPTQSAGDNSSKVATTAHVVASLAAFVPGLSRLTAALGADVLLNNTANYFDGPSVAQGSTGTWLVMANITLSDTAGAAFFSVRLTDGTTVFASGHVSIPATNNAVVVTLVGIISAPAGNIRIQAKDLTSTSGKILFNYSGNSKDAVITAIRIA